MRPEGPRALLLDTSVAVKFYLPEELREEALRLLDAVGTGEFKLLAPATVQPELLNALWQRHRRGEVSRDEVEEYWRDFSFRATLRMFRVARRAWGTSRVHYQVTE